MLVSILPPAPALPPENAAHEDDDEELSDDSDNGVPIGGDDLSGPSAKRPRLSARGLVTPGELITSDPQWMRGHGTYTTASLLSSYAVGGDSSGGGGGGGGGGQITASVAGTVLKTNKLLSVAPLRARYTPEIGDLVVGRIVEVQAKRWKVDTGSPLLSRLDLSAINLPGGILRRRTTADELQMRAYFSEGDLVVAEVQTVHQDGSASLHTRSLRYGKLRNGIFLSVSGAGGDSRGSGGGGGGVVRSRRQVWTVDTGNGGGEVEIYLGVNGYIFIAKKIEALKGLEGENGRDISRLEENASSAVYSSQNEEIPIQTRIEISRLAGCMRALVENGARVDEEMVMRAYEAALEVEMGAMDDETGEGKDYLGGERGKTVVAMAMASARA